VKYAVRTGGRNLRPTRRIPPKTITLQPVMLQ
jgi:hypothetical protein